MLLRPLLPAEAHTGRPRLHSPRTILNAIFYVLRTGCAWRRCGWTATLGERTASTRQREMRVHASWRRRDHLGPYTVGSWGGMGAVLTYGAATMCWSLCQGGEPRLVVSLPLSARDERHGSVKIICVIFALRCSYRMSRVKTPLSSSSRYCRRRLCWRLSWLRRISIPLLSWTPALSLWRTVTPSGCIVDVQPLARKGTDRERNRTTQHGAHADPG